MRGGAARQADPVLLIEQDSSQTLISVRAQFLQDGLPTLELGDLVMPSKPLFSATRLKGLPARLLLAVLS